jgi:flavin reductase (DIM6/NTAB) family NADH-FMN oxidoreductase RutF
MTNTEKSHLITLDPRRPIWDAFFHLHPLVLVGTLEPDGELDLAPKHMVMPIGWQNYFGFVCTPRHATYRNIERTREFTVTYPRPSQLLFASLAASPRCGEDGKPVLGAFETRPAERVAGAFLADGYVFLECRLDRVVDGFDVNSLIVGTIVRAEVHRDALRVSDEDDQQRLREAPLFAYVHPGRFATVADTQTFPMPAGMKK